MWQKAKNVYHLLVAVIANVYHGSPASGLTVIGVTGTDGKTTTSNLIYHILQTAEKKVAVISTVSATINGKQYDTGFHVTTPGAMAVQSYVKKAKAAGSEYLVLEVTSHALDQHRVYGIPFRVGVVTNITPEHLDYHKTYEKYVHAKYQLVKVAKTAIINRDDMSYPLLSEKLKGREKGTIITYGMKEGADLTPNKFPFETHLVGEFNRYNALAAAAACLELGIDEATIKKAIKTFQPPVGREEIVHQKEFRVMIDFAHTPNSIEQILRAVKEQVGKGRIIHVFGSAGERDKQKRSQMGEISGKYADVIILTAEDPRSESVDNIMDDIGQNIPKKKECLRVADRQEAITKAVLLAQKGDFIVITGKGHEQSMNMGNGEIPWSDHKAVEKALTIRHGQ
jgi:UDP-N-acetylmuramoyl-L-alanyl-D-glutamate--2,6-diaminopimelate ligase